MNIKLITQMMIDSGIEKNEAQKEIEIILKHFFNYTEIDKIKGKKLNNAQLKKLENIVQTRISKNFPIQYIIGEAYFMGEYFKVTPEVLIPRDETEILVNKAIEIIKKHAFSSVLDIGTGSGCIACTIAKQTNATVLGVDISSDALRIALDNVTKLNINNRAVFRKSDLFSKVRSDEKFDVIVSNPPYIPHNTELEKEVLAEPHIALFADDNGLYFYKKIIAEAPNYLNSKGYLMFELGINEAKSVKQIMQKDFENIEIFKDLADIERVIVGQLK
ncbi:MAG: peptide chain release factor N(5)-glutamine methyltransferase [bacterium]|nr:peptide chain release factor N(5)-glutamine methyltransferase [bacterium]